MSGLVSSKSLVNTWTHSHIVRPQLIPRHVSFNSAILAPPLPATFGRGPHTFVSNHIDMSPCANTRSYFSSCSSIRFRDIIIQRSSKPISSPPLDSLRFGAFYSDHMLTIPWSSSRGWDTPVIKPLAALPLHPAAQVLHYGMACFEGIKAFRSSQDGTMHIFRPLLNMDRMLKSAARLNLPTFDKHELLSCIKQLLRVDEAFLPPAQPEGYSLYIRPTLVATTPSLGVGPPLDALLFCLLSPVGPYFASGSLAPIRLQVNSWHARAYPGGVGDSKVAGNYAPTILPQSLSHQKGCNQVLYVLRDEKPSVVLAAAGSSREQHEKESEDEEAETRGIIGEAGAMNVFFLLANAEAKGGMELVTPNLSGLVLPGVTRDSVLSLARSWGEFQVSERLLLFEELESAHQEGRLLEAFATGTAVSIAPISELVKQNGHVLNVPFDDVACSYWMKKGGHSMKSKTDEAKPFSLSGRLYRSLLDIQYGHVKHEWMMTIS